MSSIYNRATPSQSYILRVIEGAVKNTCDAHAKTFDRRFAKSIAKRAAGTLTAQWPDVLAARALSVKARSHAFEGRRAAQTNQPRGAGTLQLTKRSPLRLLWGWLSSQMRGIKNRGEDERFEAFRDVLRRIDQMECADRQHPPAG